MNEAAVNQLKELVKAYIFFREKDNQNKNFDGWLSYPEFISEVEQVSGTEIEKGEDLETAVQILKNIIDTRTLPSSTTPSELDEMVAKAENFKNRYLEIKQREKLLTEKWIDDLAKKRVFVKPKTPPITITLTKENVTKLKDEAVFAAKQDEFVTSFIKEARNNFPNSPIHELMSHFVAVELLGNLNELTPEIRQMTGQEISFPRGQNSVHILSSFSDPNNLLTKKIIPEENERDIFSRGVRDSTASAAIYHDIARDLVDRYFESNVFGDIFYGPGLVDGKIQEYEVVNQNEPGAIEIRPAEIYKSARNYLSEINSLSQQLGTSSDSGFSIIQGQWKRIAKDIKIEKVVIRPELWELTAKTGIPAGMLVGGTAGLSGSMFVSPYLFSAWRAAALLQGPQMALLGAIAGQAGGVASITLAAPTVQTLINITAGQNFLIAGILPNPVTGGAILGIRTKLGAQVATKFIGVGPRMLGLIANPIVGFIGGIMAGWAIPKIAGAVKKYIVPIFAVFGGILGFGLAGGAGAIGGGVLGAIAAGGVTGGSLGAGVATVTGALAAIGGAFATAIAVPFIIALIGIPVLVAFILFIINAGAYVVPEGGGVVSQSPITGDWTCPNQSIPKPTNVSVAYSSDGQYAFPLSRDNNTSYACYHWDGGFAVDIFVSGASGETRGVQDPVVAYRSGVIDAISTNDSLGGNYVILRADSADSNGNQYYYYAHLCGLYVQEGNRVNVGDVIATSDNTGNAEDTPEHLHFAMSNTNIFYNGGTFCPQIDFEDRFGFGRCDTNTACVSGAAPLN